MADTKITALAAISTIDVNPATSPIPIVDLLDNSMAASGTTKKVTVNQILGAGGTATLASATITGDLTVRSGNKLILNRADNAISSQLFDAGGGAGLTVNNLNGDGFLLKVASNNVYQVSSAYVQTWYDGAGGTRMTLNATGLGVGASPSYKLDINGTGRMRYVAGTGAGFYCDSLANTLRYFVGSVSGTENFGLYDGVAGAQRFTIDSSGNVGIGVTPNTWTSYKALQVQSASIFSTTGNDTAYGSNFYYDGAYRFRSASSDKACMYSQFAGQHQWHYTASAGTAGNVAAFTQGMTLDASGNLLVGTTSSPSGAKVGAITKLSGVSAEGTAAINVSTTPVAISRNTGVCGLFFVMGYNASGGAQGWYLVASTGSGTPTVISSGGTPGLTLTFTMAGGQLNAQTASGTFVANAFSITA